MSRRPAPPLARPSLRPGSAPDGAPLDGTPPDLARTTYLVALGLTFSLIVGCAALWMLACLYLVFWQVAGLA